MAVSQEFYKNIENGSFPEHLGLTTFVKLIGLSRWVKTLTLSLILMLSENVWVLI